MTRLLNSAEVTLEEEEVVVVEEVEVVVAAVFSPRLSAVSFWSVLAFARKTSSERR